jgi:hypothetical protein
MERATKRFSEVHRSVRVVKLSALSIASALAVAAALSFLMVRYGSVIAGFHQELVRRILVRTAIPLAGSARLAMPQNFAVSPPLTRLATYSGRRGLLAITGLSAAGLMGIVSFRVKLSRMLVTVQLVLLAASFVNLYFGGKFGTDAVVFSAFWLRFEFVLWILLPYVVAVFAGIVFPAGWSPLFWTAAPTCYGILWSAVRLAFCLGILHLTGPLLAPLLWFTIGSLTDVLYISVFYSLIAWHAGVVRSAGSK